MRINKVNIIELHCKVVTLILHSCLILSSTQLYIWNGRYDHILASVLFYLYLWNCQDILSGLKAEIPMGISKSWNGLTISWNEKFISLKVSWPSWTELCGVYGLVLRDVHGLALRDGHGFDPHFRGTFNFYI